MYASSDYRLKNVAENFHAYRLLLRAACDESCLGKKKIEPIYNSQKAGSMVSLTYPPFLSKMSSC